MKVPKTINIIISAIFIYLLATFIITCVVSWREINHPHLPERNEIINYSHKFLSDENLVNKGVKLDCSGFTSYVFKKFKILLPRSTKQQFNKYLTRNSKPKGADLVFFTNNTVVSHVGILVNDSLFIHSPGINKKVRIDNLNQPYWKKRYAGFGCVLKD